MTEINDEQEREAPHDAILQYEILSLAKDVLSDYEMKILEMYILGLRAKEISVAIGKSEKSVNNAIYRIRTKLKKIINGGT
jgi:RNA polymerase sporulation-specific sigma factor